MSSNRYKKEHKAWSFLVGVITKPYRDYGLPVQIFAFFGHLIILYLFNILLFGRYGITPAVIQFAIYPALLELLVLILFAKWRKHTDKNDVDPEDGDYFEENNIERDDSNPNNYFK